LQIIKYDKYFVYFIFSVWNTHRNITVYINVIDVNDFTPQFIFPKYPVHTNADVANRYFAVVTSSTKPDSLVTNVITVSILIQDKYINYINVNCDISVCVPYWKNKINDINIIRVKVVHQQML
jgi:hypothetical protein